MTLSDSHSKLFDRQIRIFGQTTQESLINTSIQLLTTESDFINRVSYLSGEILKNFLLLGVTDIYASDNCITSLNKLVPDSFMHNKHIIVTKEIKKVDILILLDCDSDIDGYFICSNCYRYSIVYSHECVRECEGDEVVLDCLLGSVFVQEMVKKLMGAEYCREYKIVL